MLRIPHPFAPRVSRIPRSLGEHGPTWAVPPPDQGRFLAELRELPREEWPNTIRRRAERGVVGLQTSASRGRDRTDELCMGATLPSVAGSYSAFPGGRGLRWSSSSMTCAASSSMLALVVSSVRSGLSGAS